jgi:predicted nuclease of restriction endonuclease-like (RecB) superfamily
MMNDITAYRGAVAEIKNAILRSRYKSAVCINADQLALNYNIGRYVSENTRLGVWGTGAIETISEQLQAELPGLRGFSPTTMKYMRTFYEAWLVILEPNRPSAMDDPEMQPFAVSNRPLPMDDLKPDEAMAFVRVGFTHHREIIMKCDTWDERWYYVKRVATEFWTVETLKSHISAMDYKAYGKLPNNFAISIPDEASAARAVRSFKDEYLLDYIDIHEAGDYDERNVEDATVANIKKFLRVCGGDDFCFITNQYRMIVGEDEFFTDLLLYHRGLQRLIAFDFKRDEVTPSDLGQLSFYLSALNKFVKKPFENDSIGIILCKKQNKAVVELAIRDYKNPIGVATYRFDGEIPAPYQTLIPVIDGVQQILLESGDDSEEEAKR